MPKTWLCGTVLSVERKKTNEQSKRSTTYVTASYVVGTGTKIKQIPLQSLKASNPEAAAEPPPPPQNQNVVDNGDDSLSVPPPPPVGEVRNSSSTSPTSTIGMGTPAASRPTSSTTDSSNNSTEEDSSTVTNNQDGPTPVAVANDRRWYEGPTDAPVNGPFQVGGEFWEVTDQYHGTKLKPGCDKSKKSLNPFDFFIAMFPKKQLEEMVVNTSEALNIKGKPSTSTGEMLKFFGVMILATRYEFGCRRSLWSTNQTSKYLASPSFGRTGMSKNRFDDMWSCVVWSKQPKQRPEDISHEAHRWMLVESFVDNFNFHRKKYVKPSDTLCADESISRWYGLGGHWINMGLPMYISLDRKPEDGAEIQNVCDGHSNIMLRLKLVKSANEAAILSASR